MIGRLVRATGFSGIGRFFSTLGNMLFVLAVSKHLGAAALGIYGLLFFFSQLFSGIAPLGHPMYLAREVAHRRDDESRLAEILREGGSALIWGTGLSLLVWGVLAIFYDRLPTDLFNLATVAGVLWGVEYLLAGVLIGLERLAANAFWHGVSLALIVYCLFFQAHFPLTLYFLCWVKIISILIGLLGRLAAMKGLRRLFSLSWRLRSYRESSFFWYSGWVYLVSRQLDVLVLSFFLPEVELGGYFLTLRIFLTFSVIAEVLGVALIPFISRAYHNREDRSMEWLFGMVLAGTFVAGVPLGVAIYLSRSWLVAFFNPALVTAVSPMLASLSWVVPFSLGNHLVGAFFSASDYQEERFYLSLMVTVISGLALIPAIFMAGGNGAIVVKIGAETALFFMVTFRFRAILKRKTGWNDNAN